MDRMNLKDAERCIKDVFGNETKVFAREDFISGQKRILRPLLEGEDPSEHNGRFLAGEQLVILGSGKNWEDALRGPISEELSRRRYAAQVRALHAEHEGEMFALFLREKHDAEFVAWRKSSPLALQTEADFEKRKAEFLKNGTVPADAAKA